MKKIFIVLASLLAICACQKESYRIPEFTLVSAEGLLDAEGQDIFIPVKYSASGTTMSDVRYTLMLDKQKEQPVGVSYGTIVSKGGFTVKVPANTGQERSVRILVCYNAPDDKGVLGWSEWACVFDGTQAKGDNIIPEPGEDNWQKAVDAVSHMHAGWNLGNTLDAHGEWIWQYTKRYNSDYEMAWGQGLTTAKLMKTFADAGFTAIRVPVTWYQHMADYMNPGSTDYTVDEQWMKRVEEIVGYVLDAGMYCIINVHHDTGDGNDHWMHADEAIYAEMSAKYAALWKQIANRFKGKDEKLLFESLNEILDKDNSWNEPRDSKAYDVVNNLNQLFVNTVRATGGNNLYRNLICNTYCAGSNKKTCSAWTLPKDVVSGHIIAEVHSYSPYNFAFDVSEDPWWKDKDTKIFDDNARSQVENEIKIINDVFDAKGVPVIIGEYGSGDKGNEAERAKQAECYVSTGLKYDIGTFYWMSMIDGEDRNTCTWTTPLIRDAILNAAHQR